MGKRIIISTHEDVLTGSRFSRTTIIAVEKTVIPYITIRISDILIVDKNFQIERITIITYYFQSLIYRKRYSITIILFSN